MASWHRNNNICNKPLGGGDGVACEAVLQTSSLMSAGGLEQESSIVGAAQDHAMVAGDKTLQQLHR
jgi:hypothetical protein